MADVDLAQARRLVAFLGLTADVGPSAERALSFRLGVLYPYSSDLRRVYDSYMGVTTTFPQAAPMLVGDAPDAAALQAGEDITGALSEYVAALAVLHDRTAFASPATDASVERARTSVQGAIARAR